MAKDVWLEGNRQDVGIVLFHAYTGSPADMNLLARRLNQFGYYVLCPVFQGHGVLDMEALFEANPMIWWQQTKDAIIAMQEKVDKVIVFGLSMGGLFATRALLEESLNVIAGGIFNSPIVTVNPINLDKPFMQYAKYVYQKNGKLAQFKEEEMTILSRHHEQLAEIVAFTKSYHEQLPRLTKPYYIAQSGKDELIEAEDVYELQSFLEQARLDFHWFEDNTHVITVNPQRADFEASVERFVEQVIESLV